MHDSLQSFIDGEWGSNPGETLPVHNPATGEVLGALPIARESDLDRAIEAAGRSFVEWRDTPAWERARVLNRIADLLRERVERIARAMTLEQGKVLAESSAEVLGAADLFDWYAEEIKRVCGRIVPPSNGRALQLVVKEPVGPVAVFTPWNFPLAEPSAHVAGALAAGCTVVLKAAEETPATAMALVRACEDAGLPRGALNLVFGRPDEISTHLIASPTIRKISFTGSIPVGKRLASMAAARMKRCTMELGGNAPVVVLNGVDVRKVARLVAQRKFRNAGQVCTAPNRIFVAEPVAADFTREMTAIVRSLRVGNGLDAASQMGPLANARRVEAMRALVADARSHGARVEEAGTLDDEGRGWFWRPTVVTGMPDSAAVMETEIFGPLVPIASFADLDEVIHRANAVSAGLAAYVFAPAMEEGLLLARAIKAGSVAVNGTTVAPVEAPFGGVKESGIGRIGGSEGLDEYFDLKFIAVAS